MQRHSWVVFIKSSSGLSRSKCAIRCQQSNCTAIITKPDTNTAKDDACFILTASQLFHSTKVTCDGSTHDEFEYLTNQEKCANIIDVYGTLYCLINAHVVTNNFNVAKTACQVLGGFLPEVATFGDLTTIREVSGYAGVIWLGKLTNQ